MRQRGCRVYKLHDRISITITGTVQGVGFRPFVYRLARELRLTGHVANTSLGVIGEIQGQAGDVDEFIRRVVADAPAVAHIAGFDHQMIDPVPGETEFVIRESDPSTDKSVAILPDLATCPDCLAEINNPSDQRFQYPFTNCTNCGPRFSIINDIPYDRPNTEMRNFTMCPDCQGEYEDPGDRRFHAQPNACPVCGPRIGIDGHNATASGVVLDYCADIIRQGKILALKGIGGYQLLCDARNEAAVKELRRRKHREAKPFAVMFPNLACLQQYCSVNTEEIALLTSVVAPILLLYKKAGAGLATSVAPGNPCLGAMLPYSPLHHLLLGKFDFPVVCTSGNLHDEPIATSNAEARDKLTSIADDILSHNRSIARYVDDSVIRLTANGVQYLRRARGYAPAPHYHRRKLPNVLAVGAHFKNTIAISMGRQTVISQHIGDLSTPEAHNAFHAIVEDLPRLYDFTPEIVACDLHPDYLSSQFARNLNLPTVQVQHHHAHIASVMAEHALEGPVLGIAWDGTGLGSDGTVWGGEFLICEKGDFQRFASLRPFRLPGGDVAALEPRRSALGLLHTIGQPFHFAHGFEESELRLIEANLRQDINAPLTSSVGRLFDSVAALLGLGQVTAFEGQTAMKLEFAAHGRIGSPYPWGAGDVVDWAPMIAAIIADRDRGSSIESIAARFHGTLIEIMVAVARKSGLAEVALSGGCFQNKILYELGAKRLKEAGFKVYLPRQLPPNDGGISLGQVWVASWQY